MSFLLALEQFGDLDCTRRKKDLQLTATRFLQYYNIFSNTVEQINNFNYLILEISKHYSIRSFDLIAYFQVSIPQVINKPKL